MVETLDYASNENGKRRKPFFSSKFSQCVLLTVLCAFAIVSIWRVVERHRMQTYAEEIRAKLASHPTLQGVQIRFSPYPALFFGGEVPDQKAAGLLVEILSSSKAPPDIHSSVSIANTDLVVGNEGEDWAPKVIPRKRSTRSKSTSKPSAHTQ